MAHDHANGGYVERRALRESGPRAVGGLLDASHDSMRDDFEISVPEIDLAVETAQANSALGARLTGGGFGGSAIALVPVSDVSRVQVAIDGAFAENGFGQTDDVHRYALRRSEAGAVRRMGSPAGERPNRRAAPEDTSAPASTTTRLRVRSSGLHRLRRAG